MRGVIIKNTVNNSTAPVFSLNEISLYKLRMKRLSKRGRATLHNHASSLESGDFRIRASFTTAYNSSYKSMRPGFLSVIGKDVTNLHDPFFVREEPKYQL